MSVQPPSMTIVTDVENEITGILRYFQYGHLKEGMLRETSALFYPLAEHLATTLPATSETLMALRKLLESKDAAVRSALDL